MKKVFLETYGCQMNVSDSERVASTLSAGGYTITPTQSDADVILINTCSVREKAELKLYSQVGRIRKAFEKKPVVGVMGCVAQLEAAARMVSCRQSLPNRIHPPAYMN